MTIKSPNSLTYFTTILNLTRTKNKETFAQKIYFDHYFIIEKKNT
jgi:hypothetical protein